jgi:CyaY protein
MAQGILTIFLPQGDQLILSRQAALKEIWLASHLGAFHFRYKDKEWITQQGQKLFPILVTIIKEQANVTLDLEQIKL